MNAPSSSSAPGEARGALWLALAAALVMASAWTVGRHMLLRESPAHAGDAAGAAPLSRTGWPSAAARLTRIPLAASGSGALRRVFLDAGHGAPGNQGNTSCFCVAEEDFTLRTARALGERLEATGRFEVLLSRDGTARVPYPERAEAATRWGADAFVSLHSDVRGRFDHWSPRPGVDCPMSMSAPGFSVLWSDEGDPELAGERERLARAFARRLTQAGFPPYEGADYAGLYAADPEVPGAFVDRHAPEQRIFVLYGTAMPAVLIETHNALDPREAERWQEAATFDAFADATAAALTDVLDR